MSSPPPSAWNDELLRDPHAVADKRSRVQKMFAAIAPKYDLNNRLHSLGMDQRWRKKAVRLAELKADDRVVDVACGTGDLSFAFAKSIVRKASPGIRTLMRSAKLRDDGYGELTSLFVDSPRIVGIDFTFEMLPRACSKRQSTTFFQLGLIVDPPMRFGDLVTFANGDAQALPLADASADVVSIAFGIRNVQEPEKALAEFFRVLKPGGRVIVLEFSQPKSRVIRFFNDLYCTKIMPTTATWISGDKSGAYKYLPMSVKTFMSRETMMQMMRDAGFVDVTQHPMTFGVAVVYRGYKR